MANKKKLLLLASVLVVCVLGQKFLQRAGGGTDQKKDPAKVNSPKNFGGWDIDSLKTDESNYGGDNGIMRKFYLAVVLVVILGVGAFVFSKKLVPKLTASSGKRVTVIETIHVGPNKTLHLVDVNGRKNILLGSTKESISFLGDVTDAFANEINSQNAEDHRKT